MFITPIAAMIFTVILLIVACLTVYIVTKIYNKNHLIDRLSFFRGVVATIYFTIMIMLIINLGFNPEIEFSFFSLFWAQVVLIPFNVAMCDSSKPAHNIMRLMISETVPCIILQYIALLCS